MLQDTSKREREAEETSVKHEIAATQANAASLLSATMPKKACVGRVEGAVSTDGVASSENSLGFETVPRKHHRLVPQQQDISTAIRHLRSLRALAKLAKLLYDAYYCTIFGGAEFCRIQDSILRFETISTYWGKH